MEQKQKSFMEAYASCEGQFMRYCRALTYGKTDVDDFTQDILLSTYKNFDNIQHKEQLLHYLIRAAKYKSIDKLRRKKYRTEPLEKHQDTLTYQGMHPEMSLDTQLMYQALAKLPTKQKEAVILHEISGLSMREIAEIQDSNANAIKNKVSRGRKKLAKILNDEKPRRASSLLLFTVFNPSSLKAKLFEYKTKITQNLSFKTSQAIAFSVTLCAVLTLGSLLVFQNQPEQNRIFTDKEKKKTRLLLLHSEELSDVSVGVVNTDENSEKQQVLPVTLSSSTTTKKDDKEIIRTETIRINPSFTKFIDRKPPSEKPKTLPSFSQYEALNTAKSSFNKIAEEKTHIPDDKTMNSAEPPQVKLKKFKKDLLKHLKHDGFIKTKEDVLLWVQDKKIVINHKWLPESLQEEYFSKFKKYGLNTSYKGFIRIGEAYIIVKEGKKFSAEFDSNGNEAANNFDYNFKPKRI